jgi:2-dehydro-3-deoxyphosphogluconate aldolase/(4S)-4-hydroxy-2-oxoglutarate aldolase
MAPMNYLQLLPTGGVAPDNFTEFLEAGAAGLGMGSQLFPKQLIEEGAWEELSQLFLDLVTKYKAFKSNQ